MNAYLYAVCWLIETALDYAEFLVAALIAAFALERGLSWLSRQIKNVGTGK